MDRYLPVNSSEAVEDLRDMLHPINRSGVLKVAMIEGGWRIKQTERHYIDVMRMAYNYRLVTTPLHFPVVYDRFWCYAGLSSRSFTFALLAAVMWDGSDDTEPMGWSKNGQTGEWREPGEDGTVTDDPLFTGEWGKN